jgi:hypothetical protein
MCCDHSSLVESHWYKALFFCCRDNHFPLETCKWVENMQIIMLRTLRMHVLAKKKKRQMSLYGESQFDSKFSRLLQLINAWLKKLSDGCEHSYLKKHNGKLLWWRNLFLLGCCDQKNVLNVQYCESCPIKVLLRLPICGREGTFIDWRTVLNF